MSEAPLPMILVVEDDPTTRLLAMRVAAMDPRFTVLGVGSVGEAKELLESENPKVVILDMELPDGTGLEVLETIARQGNQARVVIVSAHVAEFPDLLSSSALRILSKPLEPEQLRGVLDSAVGSTGSRAQVYSFSISEYLQIACLGRHSVTIEVLVGDEPCGTIDVWEGELYAATDALGEGQRAFNRLSLTAGSILAIRALETAPQTRSIELHWERAVFEAAKLSDEVEELELQTDGA